MTTRITAVLASALLLAGCGRDANDPNTFANPVSPTTGAGQESTATMSPAASNAMLPFHSDLTWEKTPGSDISLCTRPVPEGKVYLMRNTNKGIAVSTHLGVGAYENHTCVYGIPGQPQGWLADIRWTAANGDVLLATSDFLYWTGAPGQSVAVDRVTFLNGGTGRFRFAEGEGTCYVDAPARTAVYEGTIRYGK